MADFELETGLFWGSQYVPHKMVGYTGIASNTVPGVFMYLVTKREGNYGAHDVFACKLCHGQMLLTRRTPHPTIGAQYELQKFTCSKCGHEAIRSVDENGKDSPDDA
ncbi:MAG: hypothetical protein JSR61_06185 [Proteobacteria bacterium]|nr:hypothetical protein [Pseudomonadota bacterium]